MQFLSPTAALEAPIDWITALKRGDRRAQRLLYERTAERMYYVCLRYVADEDIARDLMHDGYIKVFTKIRTFRGDAAVETWVTRIMVNNALSFLRQQKRRGFTADIDNVQISSSDPDPSQVLDEVRDLSAREVLDAILELPDGYRTVLSMYVLDGFTHKEIGEELGISEGTSKSQLSKARRMLRDRLIKKEPGDEG